jgi:hypothetical protein
VFAESLGAAVLCALIAYGEFVACRTAWRWGRELPERFVGLQKLFVISGPAAAVSGSLAVFFGFIAATSSSLDESGAAATWQLVVMSPVLLFTLVSGVVFFGVVLWDYPPFAIPPALRGSVVISPRDRREEAVPHRLAGPPGVVSADRTATERHGGSVRSAGMPWAVAGHQRAARDYARVMFIGGSLPIAAGVLVGLGARGSGGIVRADVAFLPFIGAGMILATYGVLLMRRRLPSALHRAVPPRGAGIALCLIGVTLSAVGIATQVSSVATCVVAAGGAAFCSSAAALLLALEAPRIRAGQTPRLVVFAGLVVGATVWAAVIPPLFR